MDFYKYLNKFETDAVAVGVQMGLLGKEDSVSVRNGKLSAKSFGRVMGPVLNTDDILVIDYYGFQKKSRGFFTRVEALQRHFSDKQIKNIRAPVVHFGAIKIETLAKITSDIELLGGFPMFKEQIINMRWGK